MGVKQYGISALSRDTGCHIETIRYYERIGLLPEPPRSDGGHRRFSSDDAKRLSFIVKSRELGFSVSEVRQLLGLIDTGVTCKDVQAMTYRHIHAIRAKIADLARLEAVLQNAVSQCEGGNIPQCPIVDVLFGKDS